MYPIATKSTAPGLLKRLRVAMIPALLVSLGVPLLSAAPGLASPKPIAPVSGPPMNSVKGLTAYIAMLKKRSHDRDKAEHKDLDKRDRDKKEDRDADADKDAHGKKLATVNSAKAAAKDKDSDGDEEDGTDYLQAYLWYLQQRAGADGSVDWSAYPAADAHRDAMPAASFENKVAGGAAKSPRGRHAMDVPSSYARWEFVGPRNLSVPYRTYYGTQALSGRVNSVAYDTQNPGTYYLASAGGGVWKTVDSGTDWTPLSDSWQSINTSVVTLDPANTKIIYVGTGDYDGSNGVGGFGVMKSTDGGLTWTNVAAAIGQASVSALVVDPDNTSIVTLTSGRGNDPGCVWRSTDGGATWAKAIDTSSAPLPSANWSDLVIGAKNGLGQRNYFACASSGSGDLLYRSSDQGATWTKITAPAASSDSLPRLAASKYFSNTLYFGSSNDYKIYKSTDNGNGWFDVTNYLPMGDAGPPPYNWSQSWYDFRLNAGTITDGLGNNSDEVLVSLIDLDQSVDGAVNWQSLGLTYTGNAVLHNDQHATAINPADPGDMLVGCDGGAFHLTYSLADNTWTFQSLNGTLGLTQFYHGAWDPTNPNIMIGGSQDNASPQSSGDLYNWNNPGAGDGGFCAIVQSNPKIQYATSQGLSIARTDNSWLSQQNITPPFGTETAGFIAPIALDPSNPHFLYAGTSYLYRYDDRTGAWTSHVGAQQLAGGLITYIAIAPSDTNRIYTGSSDGQLWMATDQGRTWVQINAGATPLPAHNISAINVNPSDPNDILVGFTNGGATHLWRCADTTLPDSTRTWVPVSGSGATALPNIALNCVTRDLDDPIQTWYAGTDVGAFYTSDGGATWSNATAPLGLPNVQVNELTAVPGTRFLNAATFGRGMWRIALPPPASGLTLTALSPDHANARSTGFTLTVTGTGFTNASTVNWSGKPRTTTFVSSTSLTATIPTSDLATPGTAYVTVVDGTNVSNALDFPIVDNGFPPTTTDTLSGTLGNRGWYTTPVTVTLTATDLDGPTDVAATYYKIDGGAQQTYTGPFTVVDDGTHTFTFWSVDNEGNIETFPVTDGFKIDATPPTVTFDTLSPAPNANGWNNTSTTLVYQGKDVTSGIASITPLSPKKFTAEGAGQTISVTAIDVAGNQATFSIPSPAVNIDETAPTTTAGTANAPGGEQITLVGSDTLSGVDHTYYTVDGGTPLTYSAPFIVTGAGNHAVSYWSVDKAGNLEAKKSIALSIQPAPVLASISPATVKSGSPDLTLTLTGADFVSASVAQWNGVNLATTYVSDSQLTAVVPASWLTAAGHDAVTVTNPAPGGGVSQSQLFVVTDAHAPVTTAQVSGQGANNRYRGTVTVTLTATDEDGASDIAATYAIVDGGAQTTYTHPIVLTGAIKHTVEYWSTDKSGNVEEHHTLTLIIDDSAPTTTALLAGAPGNNGWSRGPATVTLTASDPDGVSDVAVTYYTLDSGGATVYNGPVKVSAEGAHTMTYWSVDVAGNAETPKTQAVNIDAVAPTLTFGKSSPAANSFGWNNGPVAFPYTPSDDASGVASAAPASPIKITTEGRNQTQTVTVVDVAGNSASFTSPDANVDLTAPVTSAVPGAASISLSATDNLSGVAATYYKLDGAGQQTYTAPVALSAGSHTVLYWSVDKAGNVESAHSETQKVAAAAQAVLHTFPAGIQLFSEPRNLAGTTSAFDRPLPTLFMWSPAITQYVTLSDPGPGALQVGQGYWARFASATTLYDVGAKTSTAKPFAIGLKTGWNMIGNPFEGPVSINTLVIVDAKGKSYDIATAAKAGLIASNLYSYPAGSKAYTIQAVPGGTVDTFLGYWIYASGNSTLLVPPPSNAVPLAVKAK